MSMRGWAVDVFLMAGVPRRRLLECLFVLVESGKMPWKSLNGMRHLVEEALLSIEQKPHNISEDELQAYTQRLESLSRTIEPEDEGPLMERLLSLYKH